MATTTYGTEYVQSSDLVSNWPGSSLSVANRIDNVSLVGNGVNNQTGTSYTLALADGGKLVTFSNAAAVSLTVPTNASVAFPTGVRIKLTNKGAGTVTVAGAGGVTLNGNQLTLAQNRSGMLYKLDTNTWVMTADPTVASDPGLAFITSSTFSTSSAVNVNNCFTSTYANYQVVCDFRTTTANGAINMRLRAGGSDNTTTNYSSRFASLANTYTGSASSNATQWPSVGYGYNGEAAQIALIVTNPQVAERTVMQSSAAFGVNTNQEIYLLSGQFAAATQFDGMSLICNGTNVITGTIRVYGYRNS